MADATTVHARMVALLDALHVHVVGGSDVVAVTAEDTCRSVVRVLA